MRFSAALRTAACAVLASLVACEAPTAPRYDVDGDAASLGKKTCPGKSGGDCEMDVSVLVMPGGTAKLIVRTGSYDEGTGIQVPNGTFDKIQYKVFDGKKKLYSTKNADATGVVFTATLPRFEADYRVEVEAHIREHSGKKGMAVVRGEADATAAPDIDLSAATIWQLVNGERHPLEPVAEGSSNTYAVDFTNTSTVGVATTCVVTADGVVQTAGQNGFSFVGDASLYLAPGQTKTCTFVLTPGAGTHPVTVTAAVASGFTDANPANNSVSGSIVAQAAADVSLGNFRRLVEGGDPVAAPDFGEVLIGGTHDFRATISSPAGSLATQATCVVTINGAVATPEQIQWTTQTVALAGGESGDCAFTLNLPTVGGYAIAVAANATNDPNPANNSAAGNLTVRSASPNDPTINLVVSDIRRIIDGAPMPLGEVPSNLLATYMATISVGTGGNQTSAGATCSAKATNTRTGSVAIVPGVVTGTPSTTSPATCGFSLALAGNGTADEIYTVAVTANPVGAGEVEPASNTITGTQRAIVRSDVAVSNVQMMVDGQIQAGTQTIAKGKTATYIVTFSNGSDLPVTYACQVFAGGPGAIPAPVTVTSGALLSALPGQDKTCTFDYSFPQIAAVNFTVTAANVSPADGNPSNNTATFQTVAESDHTFPGLNTATVHALQSWTTNEDNSLREVTEQSTSITRVNLTFAATTSILGNFKLTGRLTTDGRLLNAATWTVNNLTPGVGGFANCVQGVDPGATMAANYTLKLRICAQEVAGAPTPTQVIFIEYSSVLNTPVQSPDPAMMYGNQVEFDVALDWRLYGTSFDDRATATLAFPLQSVNTGFPHSFEKTATGEVNIIRNGGA